MKYEVMTYGLGQYIVKSGTEKASFHPADSVGRIQKSNKSKSFYLTLPEFNQEIRVSDHWYMKGDDTGRGHAAIYSESELKSNPEIKYLKSGLFWNPESFELIYTNGKKPSVRQVLNILEKLANA